MAGVNRPVAKAARLLGGAALFCAAAAAAAGCGPHAAPPRVRGSAAAGAQPIEVLSWWGPVGQSDPVGALIDVHHRRYPTDFVITAKTILPGRAKKAIAARMQSGDPPDVIQSNVGSELRQWVSVYGGDDRDAKLVPLDDVLPDARSWWAVIPPQLLGYITYQGKLYGVPATVHRVNTMFYNRRVLAAHDIAPPQSAADLARAGRKLRAAGIPLFALGAREPWTIGYFLFEGLLVAREGADFYRRYFAGAETPDDPRVVATLQEGLELLRYRNADWADLSFVQAAEMVAKGQAAAGVDGDWMGVFYAPGGLTDDGDVVETAFPGSERTLVFTSDMFSLPVGAKNAAGARRFLGTIGSRDGQQAVARVKGCLSPRTDVDVDARTAAQRDKVRLLREGDLALAVSGMAPRQFQDDLGWSLIEMLQQNDVEPVVQTLRSRYRLLAGVLSPR
jgi:glucose/mannose transport system substrate-binding protein